MSTYRGIYSREEIGTHHEKSMRKVGYTGPKDEDLRNLNLPNAAKIRVAPITDSPPGDLPKTPYLGFLLVSVEETRQEKAEIVPLPGDSFAAFFYGELPKSYAFSGILLNTSQDQWRDAFEQFYEQYLRASKNSVHGTIVQVKYGNRVVSGWLMSMNQRLSGDSDLYTQFSFTLLVRKIDYIGAGEDNLYNKYLANDDSDLVNPPII